MLLDDLVKDSPYLRSLLLDKHLSLLYVLCDLLLYKAAHDEWLEQLKCHLRRNTALVHPELRSYDDNGTARVVYALSEKVLPESTLLALEDIRKRLEISLAASLRRIRSLGVIKERINSFLKHPLLIADDDIRGLDLDKTVKTVVAVNNPSVKLIEIGCSESSTIKLDHRSKIWRNDRNDLENHPLRPVSRCTEVLAELDSVEKLVIDLVLGAFLLRKLIPQLLRECIKVDCPEKIIDSLSTHSGLECIAILIESALVLILIENLILPELSILARIGYDILLI